MSPVSNQKVEYKIEDFQFFVGSPGHDDRIILEKKISARHPDDHLISTSMHTLHQEHVLLLKIIVKMFSFVSTLFNIMDQKNIQIFAKQVTKCAKNSKSINHLLKKMSKEMILV